MTIAEKQMTPRMGWIDAAKGIGILLVVYGHVIDGLSSAGFVVPEGLFSRSFYIIYTFHMPLFFFLSGLLVERRVEKDRGAFVAKLWPTIIWPYLLWSILQLSIIGLAGSYVNNPLPGLSVKTYLAILWNPPSQFWFLYALLAFHLIAAALVRKSTPAIYIIMLAITLYLLPELFRLDQRVLAMMAHFFLFYALGVCMGPFLAKLKEDAGSWRVAIAALAIFILSVAAALRGDNGYWDTALFSAAISGTALALFAATRLGGAAAQTMEYLGQRAMAIYVLHVLFVAGSRIIITRTTGVSEPALLVPALTVIGIAGPLAVTVLTDRMGFSQKLGLGGAVQPQRRPVYG